MAEAAKATAGMRRRAACVEESARRCRRDAHLGPGLPRRQACPGADCEGPALYSDKCMYVQHPAARGRGMASARCAAAADGTVCVVGRAGLEPATKGFDLMRVSPLAGLSHHPRRDAYGCRALVGCLSDRLLAP